MTSMAMTPFASMGAWASVPLAVDHPYQCGELRRNAVADSLPGVLVPELREYTVHVGQCRHGVPADVDPAVNRCGTELIVGWPSPTGACGRLCDVTPARAAADVPRCRCRDGSPGGRRRVLDDPPLGYLGKPLGGLVTIRRTGAVNDHLLCLGVGVPENVLAGE